MKNTKQSGKNWYNLDNAANLFPAVSDSRNTNVFRITCELREAVDPGVLQTALNKALKDFEFFQVVLRRGLFWHYLEHTDIKPRVTLESQRPCNRIFYNHIKDLLFNITYYANRINLEMFHVLADGNGAFELLQAIVYNYLVIMHRDELPEQLPPLDKAAPPSHQAQDSFDHHYDPKEKQSPFQEKAYKIAGTTLPGNSVRIISGRIPTKQMITLAKSKGVSITAYMASLMICGIYTMVPKRSQHKTISVNIPVDLRGHFQSETARNFFGVVDVGYNFGGKPADFDQVLASVAGQFSEKLQPTALARRMNYTMSVQKNIFARFTPLVLKNLVLRAAYHKGERSTTCALSNLGRITMPAPFTPYINSFHCLLNPTPLHRLKACVASFQDEFIINFTSNIAETKAQRYFFRHLASEGLDVIITSNGGEEDEAL